MNNKYLKDKRHQKIGQGKNHLLDHVALALWEAFSYLSYWKEA